MNEGVAIFVHEHVYILRINIGNDGIYQGYYAPLKFDQSVCVPVIESYENIDKVSSYQKNTHYT